jgi:hypothetical protein
MKEQLYTFQQPGAHVRIFFFASSGEAYDACQCDPEVRDGDVLVIASEHCVGVADTWPMAVTVERGQLHHTTLVYFPYSDDDPIYTHDRVDAINRGLDLARGLARSFGFEVRK